jgi:hypothetical protein
MWLIYVIIWVLIVLVLVFITCSKLSIQGESHQIQKLPINKACYNKQAVILADIWNIHTFVESHTRTECSRWPWEVRRCFGRDEELDVVTRTRTECPRWPREGQSLLWTEWRDKCLYRAVSGSVHPDGRDATRALCSQRGWLVVELDVPLSRVAGSHWLWCSVSPSLILCRLAGCNPLQLGAAMLHVDWLDGRTLGDWQFGVKLLRGRFPHIHMPS